MSFTKINHYEKEYADMHHDTALNVTEGVEVSFFLCLKKLGGAE